MKTWQQPPIAKVYEALGSLADGRVLKKSDATASVRSSSGDKEYTVEWTEHCECMSSNDNASFWQGYLGYPMIAVLLLLGKIPYSKSVSESLRGIPWKKINTKYRNDYEKTIAEVLAVAEERGANRSEIQNECVRILTQLGELKIQKADKKRKPPKPQPASDQADLFK
jgi:hypothetical protein